MLHNNLTGKNSLMSTLVWPIIATILLLILGNGFLYYYYYSDVFSNRTLPYFEDFSTAWYVEYRQIKGNWTVEDERLVQQNSEFADMFAVIPALELTPEQNYEYSTNVSVLEGPKGGGIMFNMQNPDLVRSSHLVRLGTNEEGDYLLYGYFDDTREFVFQGLVNTDNLSLSNEFQLGVRAEGQTYSILVNNEVVAEGVELAYDGGLLALTTWNSKVAFDDVSVSPVAVDGVVVAQNEASDAPVSTEGEAESVAVEPAAVEAETAATEAQPAAAESAVPLTVSFFKDFTNDTELGFTLAKGEWVLQEGTVSQTNPDVVDTLAIVPEVVIPSDQPFLYQVDLNMQAGARGGGMLFNLQLPDSASQSHMFRLGQREDGSEYIIYGFFDENGAFTTQGIATPLPYELATSLAIETRGEFYDIRQNDQVIVSDVPLVYQGGQIGLTTWNSAVQFDNISVSTATALPVAEAVPAESTTAESVSSEVVESESVESEPAEIPILAASIVEDFSNSDRPLIETGGTWSIQDGELTQSDTEIFDIMVLFPDVLLDGEQLYSFSTDVTMLAGPKGGGIVFNAQNSESIRESHMIRFGTGDAGDYLVYGYFDTDRQFVGTGSVPLSNLAERARLGIRINGPTYQILIDDTVVVQDAALAYFGGQVGLTTWNSSVSFDNVAINP